MFESAHGNEVNSYTRKKAVDADENKEDGKRRGQREKSNSNSRQHHEEKEERVQMIAQYVSKKTRQYTRDKRHYPDQSQSPRCCELNNKRNARWVW